MNLNNPHSEGDGVDVGTNRGSSKKISLGMGPHGLLQKRPFYSPEGHFIVLREPTSSIRKHILASGVPNVV